MLTLLSQIIPAADWFAILTIITLTMLAYWSMRRFGRRMVEIALEQKRHFSHERIHNADDNRQRIETLSIVITKLGRVLILVVAATMLLDQIGVSVGPILTGAGVVGVALGFGAQSLVRDYLAGIYILAENQFVKGDVIRIQDITGKVVDMSLRRTVLRDMSGVEHHIPNGEMKIVSNLTKEWANINMLISIDYATDIDKATSILNTVAEDVANDPEWKVYILTQPTVLGVDALSDSGVQLKLHGRVEADHQWAVARELRKRIKLAFEANKISLPYPHSVVINK